MSTAAYVLERFEPGPLPRAVDEAGGRINGVRLVGTRSRNGRVYPEAVLRQAVPLFEGVPVYIGHHFDPTTMVPREPPPEAKFGRIVNARFDNAGIAGDLKYNPKLQFAPAFAWACQNDPSMYGFSQLARVTWRLAPDRDGNRVAESIRQVASVDIVAEPGATSTIFESADPGQRGTRPMTPTEVAAGITDRPALDRFLTDLFAALTVSPGDKRAAVEALLANLPAGGNPALQDAMATATGDPAAESARRWASARIAASGLPASLVSSTFVDTVAERYGRPHEAGELIAERRRLMSPGGQGTVQQIVAARPGPGRSTDVGGFVAMMPSFRR